MYLRPEEMGAGTASARRWLVPTALVSNTMRREQRLHHEKGEEVAGSGGSRGCSSHTCRENGRTGSVPADVAGGRVWVQREENWRSWRRTGVLGDVRSRLDGAVALVSLFGLAGTCLFFGLAWTSFLVNAWSGRGSWIES